MTGNTGTRRIALLAAIGIALGATGADVSAKGRKAPTGKVYTWSFQADTLGQKPAHSLAFGGTWQVVEDSVAVADSARAATADSATATSATAPIPVARFLSQSENDDGVSHYLTFTRPLLRDMEASVRFRIRSGEIDPSAGLLFQMDPKGTSGYLVRVSGRDEELAFHYLLYGRRRDVKFAKIPPLTPGTWHTLAISRQRTVIKARYDGKEIMMVRDDRFSKGTVGVWSEDDTVVDFTDLTATYR